MESLGLPHTLPESISQLLQPAFFNEKFQTVSMMQKRCPCASVFPAHHFFSNCSAFDSLDNTHHYIDLASFICELPLFALLNVKFQTVSMREKLAPPGLMMLFEAVCSRLGFGSLDKIRYQHPPPLRG
jgi:hypothetical protein